MINGSLQRAFVLVVLTSISACASLPCARFHQGNWCAASLIATPPFYEQEQSVILEREGNRQQAIATVQWTPTVFEQTMLTPFGQLLYRLRYSNDQLSIERGALPFAFAPEYALLDVQTMIWPVALVQARLPSGMRLIENAEQTHRQLFSGEALMAEVFVHDDGSTELVHYQPSYRLVVTPLNTRMSATDATESL